MVVNQATCEPLGLETKSTLFTTITVSPLVQLVVAILLDNRNAVTASKPNAACVTTVLK